MLKVYASFQALSEGYDQSTNAHSTAPIVLFVALLLSSIGLKSEISFALFICEPKSLESSSTVDR